MFEEKFGMAFGWAGGSQDRPHHHRPDFGGHGGYGPSGFEEWGPRFRSFWGMFGPGGRRGPNMYGRGDLKFVLLELLKNQPKHGYEMIKDLEGRAGGFYTPSAGAVYPTLQLMEDRGWVTSASVDGKKVYTITEAGQQALAERGAQENPGGPGPDGPGGPHTHGERHHRGPRGPFGPHMSPELGALGRESLEVARMMRDAVMASNGDPARLAQLRAIMEQTQTALRAFMQQNSTSGGSTPPHQPPPDMV